MNQEKAELQIKDAVELLEGDIEYITCYNSRGETASKIVITYDKQRETKKSS
tara:strand:- start:205 stop:360 length:156 start_codon:yes stop_codon:yes gene_type:complete